MIKIARHFATLPGRQVHYRRCGEGLPLVLVHQSPQDSSESEPLMQILGERFTVLAPDTPGYGLSDSIAAPDDEPELDRFVDALIEWLAAMGIGRAAFYGLHSGATIATRLAARRPDLVAGLVLNGVALFSAEERRDILARYLPRFAPSWDGAHLTWLWARMREQSLFFPWYTAHAVEGGVGTGASLAEMEAHLHTFLRAGDNYRTAYRAVFAHPSEDDLARLACPVTALIEQGDPLEAHLDRWAGREAVQVRRVHDHVSIADAIVDGCKDLTLPQYRGHDGVTGRRRMIELGDGSLHLRVDPEGGAPPILLLHDAASSGRGLASLVSALRDGAPLMLPDLPGHGNSEGFEGALDAPATAERIEAMLNSLDAKVDVVSVGSAVAIGQALAEQSDRVRRLVAINPLAESKSLAAGCKVGSVVDADGAQLLAAWRLARGIGFDRASYWPSRALSVPGQLATLAATQHAAVDILKHVRQTGREIASFAARAGAGRTPDAVLSSRFCGWSMPGSQWLPDHPANWAIMIKKSLESS